MKKMTQKSLLTLILVLSLCVFALLNLCAQAIDRRYHPALDLTEGKLYALSDETRRVVADLTDETTVYVFSPQEEYPAMLREMLRRYEQLSPNIRVAYVDPAANPVLLTHYQQMGAELSAADILVEGQRRIKAIAYGDLILYDGNTPKGIDLEQKLASAHVYVNSAYTPRVVFTTGHGERPTRALQTLFTDHNYTLETKAIAVEDAAQPEIMVVAAPTYDFTVEDLALLDAYVAAGGKLMVFVEPSSAEMPNLSGFLQQWGMAVQHNVVFEPKAFAAGSQHNIIPMYTSSAVNAYFADHPVYVAMPSASSITVEGLAAHRVEPLLRTTSDAYAKTDLAYTSTQQAEGDAPGPFVVAALAGESVFLAGSRMIYADDLMSVESYGNRMFLAQVLSALWQETVTLAIPAKSLENAPLPITGEQAQTLAIVLAVVLPLMALALGTAVRLRRRRL
ncbi:MAG: GldG family protein [Clostridiales bacterium]|nr:GldG family protein [Clostridiales bacterium]